MEYTEVLEYETDNNIFEIKGNYRVIIKKTHRVEDIKILSIVKQGTNNNLIDLISDALMTKYKVWFSDRCDPAQVQENEMLDQENGE